MAIATITAKWTLSCSCYCYYCCEPQSCLARVDSLLWHYSC